MSVAERARGCVIAAARVLIGADQRAFAQAAGITLASLRRMEESVGPALGEAADVAAAIASLQARGVIFLGDDGEGPGVRLRKQVDTHDDLTRRIEAIEAYLAQPEAEAPPSPMRGMQQLESARKKDVGVKLRNRRIKLK